MISIDLNSLPIELPQNSNKKRGKKNSKSCIDNPYFNQCGQIVDDLVNYASVAFFCDYLKEKRHDIFANFDNGEKLASKLRNKQFRTLGSVCEVELINELMSAGAVLAQGFKTREIIHKNAVCFIQNKRTKQFLSELGLICFCIESEITLQRIMENKFASIANANYIIVEMNKYAKNENVERFIKEARLADFFIIEVSSSFGIECGNAAKDELREKISKRDLHLCAHKNPHKKLSAARRAAQREQGDLLVIPTIDNSRRQQGK